MRHRHMVEVLLLWLALLAGCSAAADQMTPGGSPSAVLAPTSSPVAHRTGDPQRGAALFAGDVTISGFVACRGCHAVDPAVGDGLGPNLAGIAIRAASRIPAVVADEYIRRSIQVHDEFVVPGFEPGLARSVVGRDFGDILSHQDVADLTAYLLTLDQAPVAQALTPDLSPSPTLSPAATTATPAPMETPLPAASADATLPTDLTATIEPSPLVSLSPTSAPSPSPDRTPTVFNPTIITPEVQSTSMPSSPTAAIPTSPPSPIDTATPSPDPTPTQPPAPTAISTPAANNPPTAGKDEPISKELAVYTGCMTCHDQHAQSLVKMPHVRFPQCSSCHRGSPSRSGCPTCHSMHRIQAPHGGENPDLPCSHCHADR